MSATVAQRALRKSLGQIRYVSPVPPGAAAGLVAEVYAQVEHDFGMLAPPVALHSPAAGPLAASWMMLRETLVVQGVASRAAKETVAAAVSVENGCPYCVTVHNAVLGGLDTQRPAEYPVMQPQFGVVIDGPQLTSAPGRLPGRKRLRRRQE